MKARSLLFISSIEHTILCLKFYHFFYLLGYLRFDYKRCLTCLDKFIGNVWDSFCMHFEGGKPVDY